MQSAPLIADPAGDADGEVQLQTVCKLVGVASETMRNTVGQRSTELAQDAHEICMGIALMQEHRFADACCQLQLGTKSLQLCFARCEIAVVIQAAFPYGNHTRLTRKFTQFSQHLR